MNNYFDNDGILQKIPEQRNNTFLLTGLIFVSILSIGLALTLYNENKKREC